MAGVAGGVDSDLYPVAVLIDELRHDDLQVRVSAMKKLGTIATALGPERTREELLLFLQEIIDDDDDVLIAMAEQLGQGIALVGGSQYCHTLMGPLEELCNVEELAVREKALEALKLICAEMSQEQVIQHLCALIARLASHDWYTSRISVCSLFSTALPKVGEPQKEELVKTYFRLCGDDTPMVRRQAANVLGGVAEVLEPGSRMQELLEAFEKLAKDEQDSVRIVAISNCIALGKLEKNPACQAQILGIVKTCAEDKSWRVRYMMADNVKALCDVFEAKAVSHITPLFLGLLSDPEVEVRTIAAARVAAVAAVSPTKEFLTTLMPALEKLTMPREHSQHVRASLAGNVLQLAPIFGQQLTVDHLINIFLQLIRDECPEVRLQLINNLDHLSSVVGLDVLSQSLLPSIKELGKDRQWRVRLAIINAMPDLARYLGEDKFTSELSSLFTLWLMDPVFSVRDAFAASFDKLAEQLGLSWSEANIIPQLQTLLTHKNYLFRISAMLSARSLAEVAGADFIDTHLVPMVVQLTNDPVPNVRFNAAKTIKAMHKICVSVSPGALTNHLVPCLYRLLGDEDPDVKFFAQKAIADVGVAR
eukprot:TRINITY_DN1376_c0_g1_i3.p1 TRINITY_DN1376_c0_g1~~TRINITY_DN1376_c0_g1_i3.p1  ORF type:complete len:593 (+),score=143.07 TRINITY_DN1376_c0_g1_i3:103-1881(+)